MPPRLVPSTTAGSGAGHRSVAATASVPPSTPRKNGVGLDNLLRSLEDQYQLGLKTDGDWSPARHKTAADVVAHYIRRLYFTPGSALDDALATFASVVTLISKDQQLQALSNILRRKTQLGTPSRSGTPTSAKDVPPRSLKTPQLSVKVTPRSKGIFDKRSHNEASILHEDPGSPTDEDEYDFVNTPPRESSRSPSPSVTSKSAKRRVEASSHLSLQSISRKRPSDSFIEDSKSKKLTKTSQQPSQTTQLPAAVHYPQLQFKKPSRDMARSLNVLPASQSTVNTSFNTVSSSQQTRADTANTSFTSDAEDLEAPHNVGHRVNSTTMGALDDQAFLTVGAKLHKEAATLERRVEVPSSCSQGRNSSPTWGSSIPEEELLAASARIESLDDVAPLSSPRQPVQHIGGSQPSMSSVKSTLFANAIADAAVFNQSFPPPPGPSVIFPPSQQASHMRAPSNGATPTRPQQRSPREQTPVESPSKIAHHIRDIPRQGLFVEDPVHVLRTMPYFALFICQRVSLERSVPLAKLVRNMDVAQACADPGTFWTSLPEHPKITHTKRKEPDRLWSAACRNSEGFTFKGQINLRRKRSGPIFELDLHPILPDKSCRFQRKFGADRFLYLNVPKLDVKSWSGGTQGDLEHIRERWSVWLHTEHDFLFRKWRVFHVEPMKRAKTKGRTAEATHEFRIVLFATEGCGIAEKLTVGELLDWFLPFSQNPDQSFCKAYARLDLGLSRTVPTYVFKPSQVIYTGDQLANGDREASEFDDTSFKWPRIAGQKVMNDGCSVISVGAALEIWKLYKKQWSFTGPLPSAFQGRIGGAKGLWMVSEESFTKDPEHLAIWIKISKSQKKFEPHPEDLSDASFDRIRLTFEVSNYSTAPARSDLHISFIPIMADRGVPRDIIAGYMTERLDADRKELLARVRDPVKMYEFVHKKSSIVREGSNIPWQAALPLALDEKIKLLLESGFSPLELQVLAKNIVRFVNRQHLLQETKLKTPLGKATFLFGVADPLGVLAPGEVHVQFSSSFVDEVTDEKYLNLKGHNLLIARQPAVRNSDIQKVRAILHPKLSHLVDVVVFPSRGEYPLAGKLQGGDYDGDIFWLCWEDRLVAPFQNAPAPVEDLRPEPYGIRVNRETLKDLCVDVADETSVDGFLQKAFLFRCAESLLGKVTIFLEKQSYRENRLSSPMLDHLANMHDLLVDAAKQGYGFTDSDWRTYLRTQLQCNVNIKQPIYKDAMEACAAVKDSGVNVDKIRERKYKYKAENIIDYLYFEIVRVHNIATMKEMQTVLSSATKADADLLYPCQQLSLHEDSIIKEEIRKVKEEFEQLYIIWNANTHKDDKKTSIEAFAKVAEELYERFKAIKPTKTDHPTIKAWLHPWLRPDYCLWDKLRASILYAKLPHPNAQTFVFQMAGDELAKIKAEKFPYTRSIVEHIRANMKPRPTRALVPDDDDTDEDDDVADVLEARTA